MKLINWISELFKDEKGNPSSKRFVGILCAITLCITLYHNSFYPSSSAPSSDLINAVALLAFSCLGLSSIDKFTHTKTKE
jgi:cobalamin biosynthesis protein CobD/CbiB